MLGCADSADRFQHRGRRGRRGNQSAVTVLVLLLSLVGGRRGSGSKQDWSEGFLVSSVVDEVLALDVISIIIPTLNEAANIEATLAHLQPLRVRGHEVIVVDGGSRDGTLRLARPLADRVVTAARGRARQMNTGA